MASKSSEECISESDLFLPRKPTFRFQQRRTWPWVMGTIFFACLSAGLMLQATLQDSKNEKIKLWRDSDFFGARDFIEYEDVLFYGNSAYHDNGTLYVPYPPPVDYVGPPSPEVDAAWEHLTGERDFLITESEAKRLWGDDYQIHWHVEKKGYSIGLDVFHALHCLDNLRKMFYPEHYPHPEEHREALERHRGHCIDQIRQYIMCAGDMTAYGTRYFSNPGRNYADSDVKHTCRNFNKLREYARNRYHAGGELRLKGVGVWDEWREEHGVY